MVYPLQIRFFLPFLLTLLVSVHAQTRSPNLIPEKKAYKISKEQKQFESNHLRQGMADYDVLHYHINLTLKPEEGSIMGYVEIDLLPSVRIESSLLFDFAGLHLDSVLIDSANTSFSRENEVLSVSLPAAIAIGDTQKVKFYYKGQPQKGLYFRSNTYNDMIIYSHNEPYDAHYWFPCKDMPEDKATSSTLITVPAPMVALSNGMSMGQSNAGSGVTLFAWKENYPIATYLISVVAGTYTITAEQFFWDSVILPLSYWVYPADLDRGIQALARTKEMLGFFSEYIGEYPFLLEKYDMAEVPLREAAAMENQTATTMGDFIMDDEGIIAHELAHQWWGNALTPKTFLDIWLNEGFASYFDALFTEYKYGVEAYQQQMDVYKSKMNSDGSLPYPIYNPPDKYLFGNSVYMKGAWILHMLRFEVGDMKFSKIIRDYYNEFNYSNVITENLKIVTERVSGKSFSVFFDQWLNYGGMPVIIGDWRQTNGTISLILEQYQQSPIYEFDMEVLVKGTSGDTLITIPVNRRISEQSITLIDPVREIIIDPHNKILNINNSPLYYIPEVSGLMNIYPNPSQNQISIIYQVCKKEDIEILIFDVLGQLVAKLVDESKTLGVYHVEWQGEGFATGSYYCTMKTSNNVETKKIMLVK